MWFLLAELACCLLIAAGFALAVGPGVALIVLGVLLLGLVTVAQIPSRPPGEA